MLVIISKIIMERRGLWIKNFINTTHELARELINKPDGFVTATIGEQEYIINNIRRTKTHANIDDSVTNWILNLRNSENGNIKR